MRARGPLTALIVTLAAAGAAGMAGYVAAGARSRPVDGKPRVTRIDDQAVAFDTPGGRVAVAISTDGRTLYVSGKTEVKLDAESGAASAPAPQRP